MQSFKAILISLLKQGAVKAALAKLVGMGIIKVAGFRAWIASMLLEYGFDKIVLPCINLMFRKGQLIYDVQEGKVKVKKLREARQNGNQDDYDNAADDIMG
ncbi:hypothetical protein KAR91_40850 [Candidatus Pacearchaeota archaeon]|nr:hypothetical protein [Candidatus Pacearchaeota archaeon]